MKNVLDFSTPITSASSKRKRENPSNFRCESLDFIHYQLLDHFWPPFFFSEFVVNYKVVDLRLFFLWLHESSQSNICARIYGKNIKTVQDVSISGFFQFLLEQISFLPFFYSHMFLTYLMLLKPCSNWSSPLDRKSVV